MEFELHCIALSKDIYSKMAFCKKGREEVAPQGNLLLVFSLTLKW